ncbi:IS110 family transposase [Ethanoligenens harbinense]|nr:IS110 family transposase [Ethanoligenens harbinense YUAN-3]AYF38212.1 IS110 family transposase [Ethanoligenens harbinense]AYF40957.1 IS110 family transposase [Ethanoligenens harbinense]QCN91790.1 IS110 family transposase [Ethanoligenens harbinense]
MRAGTVESTSHYHLLLFQFFQENGYEVIVITPLQSNALKNIQVRKLKTDRVDTYKLAMPHRVKVLRPSQVPMDAMRGLRLLCRQRSELMCNITRFKNRLTALLDQIFPDYDKVFADVGGAGSLAVWAAYPTPQILLAAEPEELAVLIRKASVK